MALRLAILAVLAVLTVPVGLAASATPAAAADVDVTLDRDRASVAVGDRLTITATVANPGTGSTGPLIAHLNVATLDPSVYVDLEDWTASPTQNLASLPPGGSTSAEWEIQAVNVGRFDVYVVVLPAGTAPAGTTRPVVGAPQLIEVAGRRMLSPAGVLPVTVVVPLVVGLAAIAVRLRRRGRVRSGAGGAASVEP
jgi:hypothetical protein